jgi:hypothetical protein
MSRIHLGHIQDLRLELELNLQRNTLFLYELRRLYPDFYHDVTDVYLIAYSH